VDRRLVHKLAIEEVLVTDAAEVDGGYVALTQLPRAHRLFADTPLPYYDVGLVGEAARQAVMVVLHSFLAVPFDARFVIGSVRVALDDLDANRVGPLPTDMAVEVAFDSVRRRNNGFVRGVSGTAACRIGGVRSGTFEGALVLMPDRTYETVREPAQARPAARAGRRALSDAAAVGRSDPRNVVLGPVESRGARTYRAPVAADPSDPVFFDHPQDHHPGMLLIEAARQIAIAAVARELGADPAALVAVEVEARFSRFAELDEPLECSATVMLRERHEVDGPQRVHVTMLQRGEPVAALAATVAQAGPGGPR
jgi:hypothetical protein